MLFILIEEDSWKKYSKNKRFFVKSGLSNVLELEISHHVIWNRIRIHVRHTVQPRFGVKIHSGHLKVFQIMMRFSLGTFK